MKLTPYLLPLVLSIRAVPAAADMLTDFFPPDTKVVFGVRVHNLAISSVAQSFKAQAQAQAAGIGWLKAFPLDGFDFLRDLDEVLLASSGKGPNPSAIVVVTGRFDVARLSEGAKRYHDVPLLGGEKDTDSVVALLDGGTALIGEQTLVRAAIDQRGETKIGSKLNDRITSLRQRYDVWGLGEQPEGFVAPIPEAKALESIDRFQFGMQLVSGLELEAEIHTRSPQEAEKLSAAVDMLAAMFKGQQKSNSAAKFDLHADGGTLKLAVFIPEAELKDTILSDAPAFSQTPAPAVAPPALEAAIDPAQPTPSAAPPKPRASQVVDKAGDTVVLTLPGRK